MIRRWWLELYISCCFYDNLGSWWLICVKKVKKLHEWTMAPFLSIRVNSEDGWAKWYRMHEFDFALIWYTSLSTYTTNNQLRRSFGNCAYTLFAWHQNIVWNIESSDLLTYVRLALFEKQQIRKKMETFEVNFFFNCTKWTHRLAHFKRPTVLQSGTLRNIIKIVTSKTQYPSERKLSSLLNRPTRFYHTRPTMKKKIQAKKCQQLLYDNCLILFLHLLFLQKCSTKF